LRIGSINIRTTHLILFLILTTYVPHTIDIIGLLDPTFVEKDEETSNIKWQTSPEINKMIEDVGENEKLKKKSDVASDAIQNMENNSEEPIGKQMKKNSKGFEFNFLAPNNFVCTTAVKAYGRKMDVDKALAVLPWMESKGVVADTYLLSSLLFVCAKTKRVAEAENIFWQQMPGRNLTYSVATTNSLMYMYAKLNRPDDALKVYELAKGDGD
jgi:pentatricopeptide repeat protein